MRMRPTPVLLDVLLAVVLTGVSVARLLEYRPSSVGVVGIGLAVLAVAPVALRQVAPVAAMSVIVAALAAYSLLGYGDWPSGAIGLVIALFTVATLSPRRVAAAMFPTAVGVVLLALFTVDSVTWIGVAEVVLVFMCVWGLGDATRRWAQQAQDSAARAERSVAQERTRIARELHDVVTHHMSVVAVQSGLADYVLDSDPVTARAAIAHAGDASRDALQDMGRMLDALRTDDVEPASYTPQPGLQDVDELVQRIRDAGLDVTVQRSGNVRRLAPGIELCCYRVVQESLTNVLKHADPASRTTVELVYGDRVVTIGVINDSSGHDDRAVVGAELESAGHGIPGMRARAELYGGVLDAGPVAGGGFEVRLRLPVGSTPGAQVPA